MRKLLEAKCVVCNKKYVLKDRDYKKTCSAACGLRRMQNVIRYMKHEGRETMKALVRTAEL